MPCVALMPKKRSPGAVQAEDRGPAAHAADEQAVGSVLGRFDHIERGAPFDSLQCRPTGKVPFDPVPGRAVGPLQEWSQGSPPEKSRRPGRPGGS